MKKKFLFFLFFSIFFLYVIYKQNQLIKIPKEDRALKKSSISILKGVVSNVYDGDTFSLNTGETIRLYGIDSPELNQDCISQIEIKNEENTIIKNEFIKCGINSKNQLTDLILNKEIVCLIKGQDGNNKYVGDCNIERQNKKSKKKYKLSINKEMVLTGNAIAYQKHTDKYIDDENIAKNSSIRIWGTDFEEPFEYRKKNNLK